MTTQIRTHQIKDLAITSAKLGADLFDQTSGKILEAVLPTSILGGLNYQGTWDADTNTPAIPAAAPENKGHYYLVSVSGTTEVDGVSDYTAGDWIVSKGDVWTKVDNTELSELASTTSYDNTDSELVAETVQAAIDELDSTIGKLVDLETTDQTSIVAAINELAAKSGAENFVKEPAVGDVDGVNVTFTSTEAPIPATFAVLYNGLEVDEGAGADYTVSYDGTTGIATVTLSVAPQAADGDVSADKIRFKYFKTPA
jgi:hypothetical protein